MDAAVMIDDDVRAYVARREAVLAHVRRMLIGCLDLRLDPDAIDPDTPLFGTGLGLDSVDAVELIITLEMEFDVKIPDGDARRPALRSVNALVDAILEAGRRTER
jgi:acyl carrier protein